MNVKKIKYKDKVNNGGSTIDGKISVENVNEIKQVVNTNADLLNGVINDVKNMGSGLVYMGTVNPTIGLAFTPAQYSDFKTNYPQKEPYWLGIGGIYTNSAPGGFNYNSPANETLQIVMKNNAYSVTRMGIVGSNSITILNGPYLQFSFDDSVVDNETIVVNQIGADCVLYTEMGIGGGRLDIYNYNNSDTYLHIGDWAGTSVWTNGTLINYLPQPDSFRIKVKPKGYVRFNRTTNNRLIIQGDLY